jgi:flagellar basal-body rod protein FlgC
MNAMEISRTGLDVEWRRLEIIAQNLANANTTRTDGGGPYRPLHLVSGPRTNFAAYLDGRGTPQGVEVYTVYDPSHPHADAQGYVSYPALDHAGEMTKMVETSRVYEANLVAMGIARQMYSRAIELGRRS